MDKCPECGMPAHMPEECPAAVWFDDGGTLGACEHYYVQHNEGRILAVALASGSITEVEYYEQLIDGVEDMHMAGACGIVTRS